MSNLCQFWCQCDQLHHPYSKTTKIRKVYKQNHSTFHENPKPSVGVQGLGLGLNPNPNPNPNPKSNPNYQGFLKI